MSAFCLTALPRAPALTNHRVCDQIAQKSGGKGGLRRLYGLFDTEKKGYVTFSDLMAAAKRWNMPPNAAVRRSVEKQWCNDGHEVITFDDFVQKVMPRDFDNLKDLKAAFYEKMTSHQGSLQKVFRSLDDDKGGTIGLDELMKGLADMQIQVAPELAEALQKDFDTDGDGEIDFTEFAEAIRKMDPDLVDPSKPNIGKLWEPDEEAARRIKAHRPDSADSIHSVDLGE